MLQHDLSGLNEKKRRTLFSKMKRRVSREGKREKREREDASPPEEKQCASECMCVGVTTRKREEVKEKTREEERGEETKKKNEGQRRDRMNEEKKRGGKNRSQHLIS